MGMKRAITDLLRDPHEHHHLDDGSPRKAQRVAPPPPPVLYDYEKACRLLVRAWRHGLASSKTTHIVERLLHTHRVRLAELEDGGYDAACAKMTNLEVLRGLRAVLVRFFFLSVAVAKRRGEEGHGLCPARVNANCLAFGYLLCAHPLCMGEWRKCKSFKLVETTARALVAAFERLCVYYDTTPEHELECYGMIPLAEARGFHLTYAEYVKAYKAWKLLGDAKVVMGIKAKMVSMNRSLIIMETFKAYDGEAMRKVLAQEMLTMEHRLKALVDRTDFSDFVSRLRTLGAAPPLAIESLERPEGQKGWWLHEPQANGEGALPIMTPAAMIPAEELRYVQRPTMMPFDQVTHELLIDERFTVDDEGHNPFTCSIGMRDTFCDAFWVALQNDMELGLKIPMRIGCVLSEVHHSLRELGFVEEATAFQREFTFAGLRLAASQRFSDWPSVTRPFKGFVPSLLRTLRPFRQNPTEAQWRVLEVRLAEAAGGEADSAQLVCQCLRFITECVHTARVDACRTSIRILRPIVSKCGVECIRAQFLRKINNGTTSLTITSKWLRNAAEKELILSKNMSRRDKPLHWGHDASRGHVVMRIHATACARLIVGDYLPDETTCPETLAFDIGRLRDLCRRVTTALDGYSYLLTLPPGAEADAFARSLCKYGGNVKAAQLDAASLPMPDVTVDAKAQRQLRFQVALAFVSCLIRQGSLLEALPHAVPSCSDRRSTTLFTMLEGIYARFARLVGLNFEVFESVYANILEEHIVAQAASACTDA